MRPLPNGAFTFALLDITCGGRSAGHGPVSSRRAAGGRAAGQRPQEAKAPLGKWKEVAWVPELNNAAFVVQRRSNRGRLDQGFGQTWQMRGKDLAMAWQMLQSLGKGLAKALPKT